MPTLRDILTPHIPRPHQGRGQWTWLAKSLDVDRRTIDAWLRGDVVPARRVEAVCKLLALPTAHQEDLRRRAGFQVLGEAEAVVQGGV